MSAWSSPLRHPVAALSSLPSRRTCNLVLAQTAGLRLAVDAVRDRLLFRRYLIVGVIAQGTFCRILACRDVLWPGSRMMAVKMIAVDFRFIGCQERFILSHLDSQYICRLHDLFLHNGHYCLVLDLLGPPVSCLLSGSTAPFDLHRIRKVALQMIGALVHLEEHGIIHADIKPANILWKASDPSSSSTKIQLIDFGNSFRLTETDFYFDDFNVQSLQYRAPEIVFAFQGFGLPIDMWSVGCVIAELYCDRVLFPARQEQDLLEQWEFLLGPIPDRLFPMSSASKPFLRDFMSIGRQPDSLAERWARLSARLHCRDVPFVSFISALLEYDPDRRLTPIQALQHEFFRPMLPFLYSTF